MRNGRLALRSLLILIGASGLLGPVAAQQAPMSHTEIMQMTDEVLQHVVPADKMFTGIAASRRPLFFDYGRTMAAFGHAQADSVPHPGLGLARGVQYRSQGLLANCDGWLRPGQCRALGWGIYVWLEPVKITDPTALVNVHLAWAGRDPEGYKKGLTPMGQTARIDNMTQVHLDRRQDGKWTFVKTGMTAM